MLRHVFLLIWHRKRANALLIVELVFTFLVLFALSGFALNFYRLYQRPLGFDPSIGWSVKITPGVTVGEAERARFLQLLNVIEQTDAVTAIDLMLDPVFSIGSSNTFVTLGTREVRVEVNGVSPGLPEAIGMTLVRGRWFGPEDEGQTEAGEVIVPILVNEAFAAESDTDVVGMLIPNGERQQRVVGVFTDFRQHGELSATRPFLMQRLRPEAPFTELPLVTLVVKPGTGGAFEEELMSLLQRAEPDWDFDANSWSSLQLAQFRTYTSPLLIAAILVGFLVLLVGFGLLGVLWQNVIRRTPEMGLRRAMGAPAAAVRLQVVLEMMVVALLALVLGLAIVVQFPLAGVIAQLDWALFVPSALASTAVLLALCILFALYPSWQATSKDPVEALRYE